MDLAIIIIYRLQKTDNTTIITDLCNKLNWLSTKYQFHYIIINNYYLHQRTNSVPYHKFEGTHYPLPLEFDNCEYTHIHTHTLTPQLTHTHTYTHNPSLPYSTSGEEQTTR